MKKAINVHKKLHFNIPKTKRAGEREARTALFGVVFFVCFLGETCQTVKMELPLIWTRLERVQTEKKTLCVMCP